MSPTWVKALILACTFGAVLLAVETLLSSAARSRAVGNAINLRMRLIGSGRSRGETFNLLRRSPDELAASVPPFLAPLVVSFDRLLTGARVRVPTPRMILLLVAAPAAVFLLIVVSVLLAGGAMGPGRFLLIATFSAAVGLLLPMMVLRFMARRSRKKMQEQFPVALDVFVRGLRAGHPVAAALDLLTVEMPDPIGSEFGLVVDEVTYGADLRDALSAMADRWDMEELRMFVVSLSVQSETGGNLAEILENLARVIRERASMMMKVRALSSEGRMSAIMLTILPVATFVFLFTLRPRFYLEVADDPLFVPGFVGLCLLYFLGVFIMRRMVDLKV